MATVKTQKIQNNHNGLFCIDSDLQFDAGEIKELSKEQLESGKVKHAIKTGMLTEVK